jgi:hypothetical protein
MRIMAGASVKTAISPMSKLVSGCCARNRVAPGGLAAAGRRETGGGGFPEYRNWEPGVAALRRRLAGRLPGPPSGPE